MSEGSFDHFRCLDSRALHREREKSIRHTTRNNRKSLALGAMLQSVKSDKVSSSVPRKRYRCGLRVGRDDPVSSAPQGRSNVKLVEVGLLLKSERDKRKRFPLSRVHDSESDKRRHENDQRRRIRPRL